jgi:2-dehydro-3-deoxyphosphogluconate aldolase/(4S)-4-hydroxy-2-oxoglutarate aldolase
VKNNEILLKILSTGVVAVIRLADRTKLKKVVEAISSGGVKNIEITMTVPDAVNVISELVTSSTPDIVMGAGTVTDSELAKRVINAGATFVVSPIWDVNLFNECQKHDVVYIPGCYTPTEIFQAWKAGAPIIKVFPATSLGPNYFKDLSGPFPDIRLMPTGGVTIDNVGEWVEAGAVAIGIGSDLLDKKAIADENYKLLKERASRLICNYFAARDTKTNKSKNQKK